MSADIHVVLGPHYAKDKWQGHKTILLDRAYYHEEMLPQGFMAWVSLGWMRDDGGRDFRIGEGRARPEQRDCQAAKGTIFLADHGGPVESADTIRLHPAQQRPVQGLRESLSEHKTAIGYQTTALVTAGLMGLDIVCKDKRNIMSESNWLDLLPYADWRWSEIASGEAWEHLRESI